jgi:hypothetical protein
MSESASNSEIVSYPRIIDTNDMNAFEIYLTKLRMADAKHDFGSSIDKKYIVETIPKLADISEEIYSKWPSEDNFLTLYVSNNPYVKSKYTTINGAYYKPDDDNDSKLDSFYNRPNGDTADQTDYGKGISKIEEALIAVIQTSRDQRAEIFLHVDTSYKGFKRDISYIDKYKL